MFKYKVSELTFSGGETIPIDDADVVILVGANNAGKSRALSEIGYGVHNNSSERIVIRNEVLLKEGTFEDLTDWLRKYFILDNDRFSLPHGHINLPKIRATYAVESKISNKQLLQAIFGGIGAEGRLNMTMPVKGINFWIKPFQHEIHLLQKNKDLRMVISQAVKDAFGFGITPDMHFGGAEEIAFRKGEEPRYENQLSENYQDELRNLPFLQSEGHGVRSYVGCLLATKIGHHKLIVIDEPELFLHPPQAKRLGRLMSESADKLGQQIILATHSPDIIQGVLDGTDKTAIIRINRDGDKNHAFPLSSEDIKELWRKPLLRSSGAIRGLFHEAVIVCEADADVRFYEALMQRLDNKLNNPADFYFIHGGGKGELATLAQSYTELHIPTAVIADFDMLKERGEVRKLVTALKGDFGEVEKLYNSVSSTLDNLGSARKPKEVIEDIRQLLDMLETENEIKGKHKKLMSNLLDDAREWSEAKKHGIAKLSGGAHKECQDLLNQLQEIGLFIIPSGEMESWNRSLSADKNQWIFEALELIDSDADSFQAASEFMKKIADYLWQNKV